MNQVLEPVDKQLLVLLHDEELAQHDVGLVEALTGQLLAVDLRDAGQVGDGLVAHRLGHEVAVFLGGGRHLVMTLVL